MEKTYTMGEYQNIVEKIKEEVRYYEQTFSKDNIYVLYLANGDRISYKFDENKISHLLGLNLDYLVESSIFQRTTKKGLLDKFLEDSYYIYNRLKNNYLNKLMSDYIEDKLEVFKEQLKHPYPNNVLFVCKYDRTINYNTGEIDVFTADYYIARKLRNGEIILLGLVKDENTNNYSVQTSRPIKNDDKQMEKLSTFLSGQEITYVNTLEIQNYQTSYSREYHLSIDDKKEVIQNILSLSKKTNAKPNTIKNHLYDIIGLSNSNSKKFNQNLVLSQLTDAINQKTLYDMSDINLDKEILDTLSEEVKELIKRWNDLICNSNLANSDVKNSYSKLEEENEELKQKSVAHDERIKQLEEENKRLQEEKEMLEKYKTSYQELSSKIFILANEEQNRELQ